MQTSPQMVQKLEERERKAEKVRCHHTAWRQTKAQRVEKEFLWSQSMSAQIDEQIQIFVLFCLFGFPLVDWAVHVRPEKTGTFAKTKKVSAAAWEYTLKSPSRGSLIRDNWL